MRIAIVTESFLPHVNGVTNSVLRVVEQLRRHGHRVLIVAPGRCDEPRTPAAGTGRGVAVMSTPAHPASGEEVSVVRLPAVRLPGYRQVWVSLSGRRRLAGVLADFAPDVMHLASPFVLGGAAVRVGAALGIPTVAIYQTDVAGFASRYRLGVADGAVWRRVQRIHRAANRTLAPSPAAMRDLRGHGVPRVHLWRRGVDSVRFHPTRRSTQLRARLAPQGELLIGYVGRLAAEKQVEDLAVVARLPGSRLVVVGAGPLSGRLRDRLPRATFLGHLDGDELAAAVASLDVFVHPGRHETFCQAAQEAMASGVPVVACASGGLPDLVADGSTGLLYPPGDRSGLRARVAALLADPARRRAMGARARAAVRPWTWERVTGQLVEHYQQVAGADRGRTAA